MSNGYEKYNEALFLKDQFRMREHERYLGGQKAYQETAQRYYQVMITIGYLGFLAIWSGVHKDIGVSCRNWSALLMTASALIFICYELASSFLAVRRVNATADYVESIDEACNNGDQDLYTHLVHAQAISIKKREILEKRVNPTVFLVSSLLGVAAGAFLIFGLFQAELPDFAAWAEGLF